MRSPRPTSTTAPGSFFSPIACVTSGSIASSFERSSEASPARAGVRVNAARVGELRGLRRKGDRGEQEQCSGRKLFHRSEL